MSDVRLTMRWQWMEHGEGVHSGSVIVPSARRRYRQRSSWPSIAIRMSGRGCSRSVRSAPRSWRRPDCWTRPPHADVPDPPPVTESPPCSPNSVVAPRPVFCSAPPSASAALTSSTRLKSWNSAVYLSIQQDSRLGSPRPPTRLWLGPCCGGTIIRWGVLTRLGFYPLTAHKLSAEADPQPR